MTCKELPTNNGLLMGNFIQLCLALFGCKLYSANVKGGLCSLPMIPCGNFSRFFTCNVAIWMHRESLFDGLK